jgi:hypothetical protein
MVHTLSFLKLLFKKILTGFKIYFSVFLTISFGEGDEKKDHSFVVDHDGNVHLAHFFPPGWKGRFTLSTGISFL